MEHQREFRAVAKVERKESPELFRASLRFDFMFAQGKDGKRHCLCIEINGHNSGISGVQDLADIEMDKMHKMVAKVRAHDNLETRRKFALYSEVIKDLRSGDFKPSPEARPKIIEYLQKSADREPLFKNANKNPDFIEGIADDKWLQEKYIPEEYRTHMRAKMCM